MKKIVFFIAIVLAASSLAQQRNDAGVPYLGAITATDGNPWNAHANPPKRDPQNGYAYYYRPVGTFYQWCSPSMLSFSPALVMRPYQTVTYQARAARQYEWTYQQGGDWFTTTGNQNLDVTYGCEVDSMPKLKIGVGNTYFTGGWAANVRKWSEVHALPDPSLLMTEIRFENDSTQTINKPFYVSPKWWSMGNREGYSTWIAAHEGAGEAKFYYCGKFTRLEYGANEFGKNDAGFDSISLWVEAPQQPYLLRGFMLIFRDLLIQGDNTADLNFIIRRAAKDYETDIVTPGDELARATLRLDSSDVYWATQVYQRWVEFPSISEYDTIQSWQCIQNRTIALDVPLVVDSEILITLAGYNDEKILDFDSFRPKDIWNEGYGDHFYIYYKGQNGFSPGWKSVCSISPYWPGAVSSAPSIFMDVKFPYTMLRDEDDTGVRQVGAAGGKVAVDLKSSDPGSEQQVTIESLTPGSDDVSWLTVGFTDGETSELGEHSLTADLNVAPNTAGTPRSARVTITMPASPTVTLLVNQTDGIVGDVTGDGQVDIADVNAVINIMLGKADTTAVADVTGDGQVDIADVNAVINIMLGK
jgi:hypothetical protein